MTQWYEHPDGRLARYGRTEHDRGRTTELLRVRDADPGAVAQLTAEWRPLSLPAELPSPGVRQCVRCRRLNFGPCTSATCTDLQAPPPWLAPLLGPGNC